MPKISIIVPAFNAATLIQGCISSLLCQTLTDIEIIAVNDGSIDATGEILDQNAKLDSRLHVIHQENGGLGKALNAGMDKATGEYIAFLPMEWRARPDAYGSLWEIYNSYGADVVTANYYNLSDGEVRQTSIPQDPSASNGEGMLLPQEAPQFVFYQTSFWPSIYRRSLLFDNNIRFNQTPGSARQEISFTYKVWCCAKMAWFMEQRLFYCLDPDHNPAFTYESKLDHIRREYDCAIKFAREQGSWLQHEIQKQRYLKLCEAYDIIVRERGGRHKYARKLARDFRKDIAMGSYNGNFYARKEKLKFMLAAYLPTAFMIQRSLRGIIHR